MPKFTQGGPLSNETKPLSDEKFPNTDELKCRICYPFPFFLSITDCPEHRKIVAEDFEHFKRIKERLEAIGEEICEIHSFVLAQNMDRLDQLLKNIKSSAEHKLYGHL